MRAACTSASTPGPTALHGSWIPRAWGAHWATRTSGSPPTEIRESHGRPGENHPGPQSRDAMPPVRVTTAQPDDAADPVVEFWVGDDLLAVAFLYDGRLHL